MKLLGVDYGRRRIGIAVSDETGICIRGCGTIDRKKCNDPLTTLAAIITRESPAAIIFGIPLGPHDEETVMSKEVRDFAGALLSQASVKIPVHFIDESFSSIKAKQLLSLKRKKQRRKKENIDILAACGILESFQRLYSCERKLP